MTSRSKAKGNAYERELVEKAKASGLESKRAWGSNGQALGHHEEVDILIDDMKVQAKRRKKLPDWLGMTENVDVVVVREDRGESFAVIRYSDLLSLLKECRDAAAGDSAGAVSPGPGLPSHRMGGG